MILASSCASIENRRTMYVTKATVFGISSKYGNSCSAFSLTISEAQFFFIKSKVVTANEIHDEYPVLPCFVSGKGELNNESCSWKIRAGGTGHVICKSQSFLTACDDCFPR